MLGKSAPWFEYKSLKNLSRMLSCLLRITVMLKEINCVAAEYQLATDENRGGVKQPLLCLHLTLIKWSNKGTLVMAMENTGDFILPSAFMGCPRVILPVQSFCFLALAGATSIHGIFSQNCAKGF